MPRFTKRVLGTHRIALLAALLVLGLTGVAPASGDALGPGCDSARPAVTHRAGGAAVDSARVRVPCGTETGQYTGETTIGVTDDGTVWFSAADWEWALVRTRDDGATWERYDVPGPQAYPGCSGGTTAFHPPCSESQQDKANTVADAFLWVDPDTSSIFWSKTYGYALCSSMNYSHDGEDWHPVTRFACPGGDYEKIAGGPPPAGGAQPVGYPNVLYTCYNGPAPTFVVGPRRDCAKSLDGGATWALAGAPVPSPLAPGCLHFQEPPAVGPDGTVFQPLGCTALGVVGAPLMVALSHDEAATWSYVPVPDGGHPPAGGLFGAVSLAVDDAGTIFVVWQSAGRVHLASSADQGQTWTGPFDVTAPGVTAGAPSAQVAAREAGHVAIAYYGSAGDPRVSNGYLTESFDAGAADPVFHSASVNDPADPLYFPTDGGTLPRNDYLGVTIAPDGTPWAAFVKLRTPDPDAEGFIQSTGFAGRMVAA